MSGWEWENQSLSLPGDVARALGGVITGPPLSVAVRLCVISRADYSTLPDVELPPLGRGNMTIMVSALNWFRANGRHAWSSLLPLPSALQCSKDGCERQFL